jgi:hypothetical protein
MQEPRTKLPSCCTSISFNVQCLHKQLVPTYAKIRAPRASPTSTTTMMKAQVTRIKEEIRFQYKRKEYINQQLYTAHMQVANEWGQLWNIIEDSTHHSLHRISERRYQTINENWKKLNKNIQYNETPHVQFHPGLLTIQTLYLPLMKPPSCKKACNIIYSRHVKHAARVPHAALCKHTCGPHKGYCNLVI